MSSEEEIVGTIERNQIGRRFIIEHDKDLPTASKIDLLAKAIRDKLLEKIK